MVYLSYFQGQLVVIPLVINHFSSETLNQVFKREEIDIRKELFSKLFILKEKGFVLSVSPDISNPKDVGETFERELGIDPNSRIMADYKGKIELKAKRESTGTKDTLFSMVPNWSKSFIKSSNEMILSFGYEANKLKYNGYLDLFITVNNRPNNQGLYLETDEDNNYLHQMHSSFNDFSISTCVWDLPEINSRLMSKHSETIWVVAKEKRLDGRIYFAFDSVEHTQRPIFSSFLLQISKGIVTYDWRGRVKVDGSKYKDKGHCFRINPKYRNTIFGETNIINLN